MSYRQGEKFFLLCHFPRVRVTPVSGNSCLQYRQASYIEHFEFCKLIIIAEYSSTYKHIMYIHKHYMHTMHNFEHPRAYAV